jgi:hypothetical protein
MAFLALGAGVLWMAGSGGDLSSPGEVTDFWLYPVKTAVVLGLLIFFWPRYEELRGRLVMDWREGLLAVGVGIAVYLAWVRMDWSWATQGTAEGYDPFKAGPALGWILAGIRIFGAAVVVPIMEELFWRSFLIRYVIDQKFESVRLGTFTPLSFALIVVLFGLEHNLWLAGMMAGTAYTLLLYRTGRLWPCILAHAVTNLALGIHVLVTGEWQWW